jgi:hypothetical protein
MVAIRLDSRFMHSSLTTPKSPDDARVRVSPAVAVKDGERGRNRTYNLLIKSQLLCQLSYAPTVGVLPAGQFLIVAFFPAHAAIAHSVDAIITTKSSTEIKSPADLIFKKGVFEIKVVTSRRNSVRGCKKSPRAMKFMNAAALPQPARWNFR